MGDAVTVRREARRGEMRWVIDIVYRKRDGTRARYRKDAQVQTALAARAEERRLLMAIAEFGEPLEPVEQKAQARAGKTFAEVVEAYRGSFMVTDLKVTSRRGYASILASTLLPWFGGAEVEEVDGDAARALELELAQRGLSQSTRNNVLCVLRSVLRYAAVRGWIERQPEGLPGLRPVGQSILEIPTDEEVARILGAAVEVHRVGFALMAFAGLRPNEVRALRWKDLRLEWEAGKVVGGFVQVREGRSFGEVHTPKTGQREVPIAAGLAEVLGAVVDGERGGVERREAFVAVNEKGEPWGQYGLARAFERVRGRVGLAGCVQPESSVTLWTGSLGDTFSLFVLASVGPCRHEVGA